MVIAWSKKVAAPGCGTLQDVASLAHGAVPVQRLPALYLLRQGLQYAQWQLGLKCCIGETTED
jgi:hypothetical protein